MRTYLDCYPCFIRQSLEAARLVTDEPLVQQEILRRTMQLISKSELTQTPPAMGQQIHRIIRQITKNPDPYEAVKAKSNKFAASLIPHLKKQLSSSPRPFETAVRLAIAGNIIDFGAKSGYTEDQVHDSIAEALSAPMDEQLFVELSEAIAASQSILYIADNAGEVFFDRLLIEMMPWEKTTYAVRGAPTINDATVDDAKVAAIDEMVEIIDNGSDAPGTVLEDCSDAFRKRFEQADLIIAKGQGNYETLSDIRKNIFFMLKVKCPVVAGHIGYPVGSTILLKHSFDKCLETDSV
ncbi:MAG: ARMT1-like domain-containing protein [Phycisphaerales bacterium]|jgi:hypothetical protein